MKKSKFQHPKRLGDQSYLLCKDSHIYIGIILFIAIIWGQR